MKKPSLPERLAAALLLEIASGNYSREHRFLSRREIMQQWKVSCYSATESLRLLCQWRILEPHLRSGHRLCPNFRTKAMLRMSKKAERALPGQPDWNDKARALLNRDKRLSRIAVIVCSAKAKDLPLVGNTTLGAHLLPSIDLPAKTIFAEANRAGITVNFYLDDGTESIRQSTHKDIRESDIQGIIILRRLFAQPVDAIVTPLLQQKLPVITAFGDCANLNMVSVNFNNVSLGYKAALQFIDLGHRHIAVSVPSTPTPSRYFSDRLRGVQLAAREYNTAHPKADAVYVTAIPTPPRSAKPLARVARLFQSRTDRPITALLATTVNMYHNLEPSLRKARLRIPEDLSVILCSSSPQIGTTHPPKFDTMRMDFEQIGRHAFQALQASYNGQFTEKTWLIEATYESHGTSTLHKAT